MFAQKLLIANWKMNGTRSEWRRLAGGIATKTQGVSAAMALCVPAAALGDVAEKLEGTPISLGAQNVCIYDKGAYTGETSAEMVASFGANYTLVGHSERRENFGESNVDVNRKIHQAMAQKLVPIVCIGEDLATREAEKTISALSHQLNEALEGVVVGSGNQLIVAYEPVWAISSSSNGGKRKVQTNELLEVFRFLRQTLVEKYSEIGYDIKLVYGGSVNAENINALTAIENIDGALVGAASLDVESFSAMAKNLSQRN